MDDGNVKESGYIRRWAGRWVLDCKGLAKTLWGLVTSPKAKTEDIQLAFRIAVVAWLLVAFHRGGLLEVGSLLLLWGFLLGVTAGVVAFFRLEEEDAWAEPEEDEEDKDDA